MSATTETGSMTLLGITSLYLSKLETHAISQLICHSNSVLILQILVTNTINVINKAYKWTVLHLCCF